MLAKADGAGLSKSLALTADRQKVISRLSEQQATLLNREQERAIFSEAVLDTMLRSLLEGAVKPRFFPQALANQTMFYGKLTDQLAASLEEAGEWRGSLQQVIEMIEAGHFDDADRALETVA